ncbi:MAG: hypothetical protein MUE42_03075 [Opitutaceae bacterium]|jgi:hypothetical protein|nr:hypothetical protein [Opitutaceae bacterium]
MLPTYRFLFVTGSVVLTPFVSFAAEKAPADSAAGMSVRATVTVVDFGDHSSAVLTTKAWAAYEAKDSAAVAAYTGRCRELYFAEALRQQAALTAPIPATETERISAQWALNDVGTCLYIMAQTHERDGQIDDAVALYRVLVERLAYAQCWDVKGWFWSPVDAAKGRLRAIEFERAGF